jgi:tRNA G10  N-methylase Trm11
LTGVRPIQTNVFRANAADANGLREELQGAPVDIVFTDIPYGQHSEWMEISNSNPTWAMLEALRQVLPMESIIAVASDKLQKISHEGYRRLEKVRVGKRQVVILQPI